MGFMELKSRCQQGCNPSGSSREQTASLAFLAVQSACIPCLMAPSCITASNTAPSLSHTAVSLLLVRLPPLVLASILVITMGPSG